MLIDTMLYYFNQVLSALKKCWLNIAQIINNNPILFELLKIFGYVLLIAIGFRIIEYFISQFSGD